MPIAHIIVAPDLTGAVTDQGLELTSAVRDILVRDLGAKPQLVQVMITAALTAPAGCEVLCQVQHRASPARDATTRARAAQNLHDLLHHVTGHSTRVRLIALDPDHITAADTPEPQP
ncbi:hypothetical protein ERN12_12675 [Rhodobacteraceae bacterium]|nr:hypothetical protein ERN12_12675 [Paracoccaceae bacterium]